MKTISVTEIQENLQEYLTASKGEPILVTDKGETIAAITIIIDPDELERLALANNLEFNRLLKESDKSIQETGGIPHDEFWQKVVESYQE